MNFKIITLADFPDYIKSEEYKKLKNAPITPIRVKSQVNNPRANSDDVVLVLALQNDEVVAYAGALPDFLYGNQINKVVWSSGWWSHSQKGKKAGLPVFLKLLECSNYKMLFSNLTPTTKQILEKLRIAEVKEIIGIRAYLRMKSYEYLTKRIKLPEYFKCFFLIIDAIINLFLLPKRLMWKISLSKTNYSIKHQLVEEDNDFVSKFTNGNVVQRKAKELNWIINNPWITQNKHEEKANKYVFSTIAKQFMQYYILTHKNNKITGIAMLHIRNGEGKIPYLFAENCNLQELLRAAFNEFLKHKVNSVLVHYPKTVKYFTTNKLPSFYKRKTTRFYGFSKPLNIPEMNIQDGDGDVGFT